jgi:hypothetical protein
MPPNSDLSLPPNLSVQNGVGFVTLGNGPGYTYGPVQNPTSTTFGMQEALNAISTSTNANYGKTLIVYLNGACAFTTQISFPNVASVLFPNGGGEGFGPVLSTPSGYLNFTGASTVGVPVLFPNGGSNVLLDGFALQTAVASLTCLMQVTGFRSLYSANLYCVNTASGGIALQCDGTTDNCEDNLWISAFCSGDTACKFGASGEAQHFNDSVFVGLTAEGLWNGSHFVVSAGATVINSTGGSNIQLINFYSRGDTYTNYATTPCYQITVSGSTSHLYLYGGEQRAVTSSNNGGLWNVSGGSLVCVTGTTSGGVSVVSGGVFVMDGFFSVSGASTLTQSGGTFAWGPYVNVTNLTYSGSAGTLVPPFISVFSTGSAKYGMASYTNTGASITDLLVPVVASLAAKTVTSTPTLTYTPTVAGSTYRATFVVKVTTHVTSSIPNVGFTDEGNVAQTLGVSMSKTTSAGVVTTVGSLVATGYYSGTTAFSTNASANITLSVVITSDTINYTMILERLL